MPKRRVPNSSAGVDLGHGPHQTCPFIWLSLLQLEPPRPMAYAICDDAELRRIVRQLRRLRPDVKPPAWLADAEMQFAADLIRSAWFAPDD